MFYRDAWWDSSMDMGLGNMLALLTSGLSRGFLSKIGYGISNCSTFLRLFMEKPRAIFLGNLILLQQHNFHVSKALSGSLTSFAYTAVKEWNELPTDLKSIELEKLFRRKLRDHLCLSYWYLDYWTDFIGYGPIPTLFYCAFNPSLFLTNFCFMDPNGNKSQDFIWLSFDIFVVV